MYFEEKDYIKAAMKEAMKEWLDDKFATFGKWTAMGIATAALVALTTLILMVSGWKPPV